MRGYVTFSFHTCRLNPLSLHPVCVFNDLPFFKLLTGGFLSILIGSFCLLQHRVREKEIFIIFKPLPLSGAPFGIPSTASRAIDYNSTLHTPQCLEQSNAIHHVSVHSLYVLLLLLICPLFSSFLGRMPQSIAFVPRARARAHGENHGSPEKHY